MNEKNPEIVGIGANVYDTLIKLPDFPVEDTKMDVEAVMESGGGPCGTGLVAATRLGARTAWIGSVSDDRAGLFLLDDFKNNNVSTEFIEIVPNCRTFSATVLLSAQHGSRTCLLDRGSVPPTELTPKHVTALESAKILMVDGNDRKAAIEGAKIARKAGKHVLYDAGGLHDGLEPLLELSDILIPSEEFALGFTGQETVVEAIDEFYKSFRPKIIAVTRGEHGGVLYDGNEFSTWPAFKVETADTNGAGDVFHGAFAFALLRGMSPMNCCVFSSAVAAIKCARLGARRGVPTYGQTLNFLKEREINELQANVE